MLKNYRPRAPGMVFLFILVFVGSLESRGLDRVRYFFGKSTPSTKSSTKSEPVTVSVLSESSSAIQTISTAPKALTTEEFLLAAGIPREGLGWIVLPASVPKADPTAPQVAEKKARFSPSVEIYGTKSVEFNNYKYKGDFNQFVQNNPMAITDSKFEQHTRVTIQGEVTEGTHIHAVFDDSAERDEDDKILLGIRGDNFDLQMGRIDLKIPDTKYVLHNKKAMGIALTHKNRKLSSSFLMARSEGVEEREQFFGQGLQREYLLKKAPVVPGSERVTIDGRELVSGVDYRVDYEGGTLQFDLKILPIENTESIIVEYESLRDGNAFKNRIFSLREKYDFDEKNHLGLTWALSKDQIDEDMMLSTNLSPQQLSILGMDGKFSLRHGIAGQVEMARSVQNLDIASNSLPLRKGSVIDLGVSQTGRYHKVSLQKERISPGYRAIGRDAFLTQGEDSGLLGDIDQNSMQLGINRGKTSYEHLLRESETNLDHDPLKDTTEFFLTSGNLKSQIGSLPVRAGYKNENKPTWTGNTLKEYQTQRKHNAGLSWDLSSKLRVDVDKETEKNRVLNVSGLEIQSQSFALSSRGNSRLAWNYGFRQREAEDMMRNFTNEESQDHLLNLNWRINRDLQAQIEYLRREEDNFVNRETLLSSATGMDLRYRVGRKFDYSVKVKEELKRRLVLETTNLNLVDLKNPDKRKDYVTPPNPVQTLTTSQILRWDQSRDLDHRLSYRTMEEEERIVNKMLSSHEDIAYDLRWNLPYEVRLNYRLAHRDRLNLASALDQKISEQETELTRSLGRDWMVSARYLESDDEDLRANNVLGLKEDEFKVDKTINLNLRGYASVIRRDYSGREDREEMTLGTGILYTPMQTDLRLGVDLSKGKSEDRITKLDSDLEKIQLSLQKEIFKDAILEGIYKHEVEAPSSKGTGYTGTVYNVKVSMDF